LKAKFETSFSLDRFRVLSSYGSTDFNVYSPTTSAAARRW
jgi:hypothetical protein